jgi:hypothetical protein
MAVNLPLVVAEAKGMILAVVGGLAYAAASLRWGAARQFSNLVLWRLRQHTVPL